MDMAKVYRLSFLAVSTSIYVNGANISPVEKLFYLRQFMRSEALEIIKKFPLTANGFQEAWNNLKGRYTNKRISAESFIYTRTSQIRSSPRHQEVAARC